jgi:heme A synthase
MVSVRLAGAACESGCAAQWLSGTLRLWDPLLPGAATDLVRSAHAGAALHAAHRLLAIVVVVLAVAVAARRVQSQGVARGLLAALALCAGLGLALSALGTSLALAVAHALAAGVLVAAVGELLARGMRARETA